MSRHLEPVPDKRARPRTVVLSTREEIAAWTAETYRALMDLVARERAGDDEDPQLEFGEAA